MHPCEAQYRTGPTTSDPNAAANSSALFAFFQSHLRFSRYRLSLPLQPPDQWRYEAAPAGTCPRKNPRTCSIVPAFSSGGSRHGNTVISARGANAATSIDACNGCAGVASGSTSIGVWHPCDELPRHAVNKVRPRAIQLRADTPRSSPSSRRAAACEAPAPTRHGQTDTSRPDRPANSLPSGTAPPPPRDPAPAPSASARSIPPMQ